jgi:hypothetical protein
MSCVQINFAKSLIGEASCGGSQNIGPDLFATTRTSQRLRCRRRVHPLRLIHTHRLQKSGAGSVSSHHVSEY